jgi:hypothetical protein
MTDIESLRLLTEAVETAGADIAPTYAEYVQLAFAIATDCGDGSFFIACAGFPPSINPPMPNECFPMHSRNSREQYISERHFTSLNRQE